MYPEAQLPSADEINCCSACHLRQAVCLCAKCPELSSHGQFFLLVHQRELAKPTNTGHLLLSAFADTQYEVWSRVQPPKKLLSLLSQRDVVPYVIFPGEDSSELLDGLDHIESTCTSNKQRPLFILLDATWQEAKKMYRHSPYLQSLPHLALGGETSRYHLRRNQQPGNLSTLEAAVSLLMMQGESSVAKSLEDYFDQFLLHYEASRSGHGVL